MPTKAGCGQPARPSKKRQFVKPQGLRIVEQYEFGPADPFCKTYELKVADCAVDRSNADPQAQ
ncbi:MAG: hypothetical protein ACXIT4_06350 [Erythrobacter sp.]